MFAALQQSVSEQPVCVSRGGYKKCQQRENTLHGHCCDLAEVRHICMSQAHAAVLTRLEV